MQTHGHFVSSAGVTNKINDGYALFRCASESARTEPGHECM